MSGARAHVVVSGRVQGVGFRHATMMQARKLALTGWVRNLPDGRVEAVFEGPAAEVTAMEQWCHEGPIHARVDDVRVTREDATGEFERFEIGFR